MGHPVKNVSNQQVLDALKARGYTFPDDLDTRGVQTQEFRRRINDYLNGSGQANRVDIFGLGVRTAKDVVLADQAYSPGDRFTRRLAAYGVDQQDIDRITKEAQSSPGSSYDEGTLAQAAYKVLGYDNKAYVAGTASIPGAPRGAPTPAPAPAPGAPAAPGAAPAGPPGALPKPPVTAAPKITPAPKGTAGGGAGGAGKPPIGDTSTLPRPMNPAEAEAFIRQHYGYMASLLDIPDIHKILTGVATGEIAPDEFDHQLLATDWARTRNDAQQAWQILKATKPAQAEAQLTASGDEIKNFAVGLGFTLDDPTAKDIATSAMSMGWDPNQTRSAVASHYQYVTGKSANAGIAAQLATKAQDFLIPLGDQALTQWGQQIISGTSSMDQFVDYARNIAKGQYSGLGAWLDQDPTRTVKQYITPYANQAAEILETPADQIDFTKPKYAALFGKLDPKTGERSIMTGPEWASYLKQQPDWQYTKNAHETVSNLTSTLAQTFGTVG